MRMENRAERMGQAAAQADVLDFSILESQQKDQKVGKILCRLLMIMTFNY